ncbi:hypothetical protein Tco_0778668 [Tanacetum coccineum]
MSTSNQQTLADSEANERPPMHEKGNYIPWESRPIIPNPDNTIEQILKPMSKMNEGNKKQYIADVKVMNYLLQAIPNDIYNSMDACKNAKDMWERIKRLMFGSEFNLNTCSSIPKAKRAAKNHDPLALIAHSNASLSNLMLNSSYSPQNHTMLTILHPLLILNEYQGELQGDSHRRLAYNCHDVI